MEAMRSPTLGSEIDPVLIEAERELLHLVGERSLRLLGILRGKPHGASDAADLIGERRDGAGALRAFSAQRLLDGPQPIGERRIDGGDALDGTAMQRRLDGGEAVIERRQVGGHAARLTGNERLERPSRSAKARSVSAKRSNMRCTTP